MPIDRQPVRLAAALAAALALAGCGQEVEAESERSSRPTSWRAVPDGPLSPREDALALWTGDRVLVAGGSDAPPCPPTASCVAPDIPPLSDGATFDPATGQWERIADSPVPFQGAEGLVLGATAYVWAYGIPGRPKAEPAFLAYATRRDRWRRLPVPPGGTEGRGVVAAGGRIVAYSTSDEYVERPDHLFDPDSGVWTELPPDPLSPSFDRTMAWTGAELVLFEHELVPNPGAEAPALTRAAALALREGTWRRLPDSQILGTGPWALHEGRLINPTLGGADGGETNGWGRTYPQGGILDPGTGEWSSLPDPPKGEQAFAAGVLTSDGGQFFGHRGWVLDARTAEWLALPPLDEDDAISQGRAIASAGDDLFVFGGARWDTRGEEPELLADAAIWSP